jgi:hypothetical protein
MSFRCERCGKAQPAGIRPNRVVVKRKGVLHRGEYGDTPGTQIAKEQNECDDCFSIPF